MDMHKKSRSQFGVAAELALRGCGPPILFDVTYTLSRTVPPHKLGSLSSLIIACLLVAELVLSRIGSSMALPHAVVEEQWER